MHPDKTSEIRQCAAVGAIYPRVKALEAICTPSCMKAVLEHIQAKKTELDRSAMVLAFGESFVTGQVDQANADKENLIHMVVDKSTRVVVAGEVDEQQVATKSSPVASERKVMTALHENRAITFRRASFFLSLSLTLTLILLLILTALVLIILISVAFQLRAVLHCRLRRRLLRLRHLLQQLSLTY